ncbi:MAG TPA: metal ABC transporter substrate-binding protein [Myxococcaceae bacterium]|nr:metal ABC transporter substrate-binding protein [Myxococcaceae bacterium]
MRLHFHFRLLAAAAALLGASPALAKLYVVTTTQDPAAITRAIGGDRVDVKPLAKGFQDPHFLDAKPTFMVDLHRADLFEVIGLDLEIGYAPSLIAGAHNEKIAVGAPGYLDLSQGITPLEVVPLADRGQGDIHPNGNPHYWLDPENGRLMARAIAARLTQLDPAGKQAYADNLAAFEKTLTAKEAEWSVKMSALAGQSIITYHRSWTYFLKRYQLQAADFVEPKPGIPPVPAHTLDLIKMVQGQHLKLILMEVFYDKRVPELIAAKSGAKLVTVPNSVGGTDAVKTYFDLFDTIVGAMSSAAGS